MIVTTNFHFDSPIQLYSGESDALDRIVSYLTYAGVDAMKAYDDEENIYTLFVPGAQESLAEKLLRIYLSEEQKQTDENQRIAEENESAPYSHVYENCKDRYQNHLSTAITFFIVGTGLLFLLILSQTNILPIGLGETPLSLIVTLGIAILFDAVAVVSLHRALQLKTQIADEEALTNQLISWFLSTYDRHQIDTSIAAVEGEINEDEVLYLKRLEQISCYLNRENEHLDPAYAAKLSEDLYGMIYDA